MTRNAWLAAWVLATVFTISACAPSEKPQTGSQTNWLLACETSAECGALECLCGVCTVACDGEDACAELAGGSCVPPSDEGSVALCGGEAPAESMCLQRCEAPCGEGTRCVAGVCAPIAAPVVHMEIDTSERHQTLVGFGASLAFADDVIVARADKEALYDLVFTDAGLSVIRLRNRFADSPAALEPAREIVAAAAERIGRAPFLFMTSGTPPAELKANASRTCAGDAQACTLRSLPSGGFDYQGFASFWRESLDAYAAVGLVPDYVSIQNNPNWVPGPGLPGEGCRFLPEEGMTTVELASGATEIAYPGYREAIAAVRDALTDMPAVPRLAAPEATGPRVLADYARAAGAPMFEAIALHLYGQDAAAVDVASLRTVAALASELDRPVFQTEMRAEGLDTAIFAHHALTGANAAAYVQNDLVALVPDQAAVSLVLFKDGALEPQGPYYALKHFAKHTARGFQRVEARSDSDELLVSAWIAPDDSALTVVVINPSDEARDAALSFDTGASRTAIARTIFDGDERFTDLGPLSADGVVRVPPRSIVTVSRTR